MRKKINSVLESRLTKLVLSYTAPLLLFHFIYPNLHEETLLYYLPDYLEKIFSLLAMPIAIISFLSMIAIIQISYLLNIETIQDIIEEQEDK